jgi:hypothetical protein
MSEFYIWVLYLLKDKTAENKHTVFLEQSKSMQWAHSKLLVSLSDFLIYTPNGTFKVDSNYFTHNDIILLPNINFVELFDEEKVWYKKRIVTILLIVHVNTQTTKQQNALTHLQTVIFT